MQMHGFFYCPDFACQMIVSVNKIRILSRKRELADAEAKRERRKRDAGTAPSDGYAVIKRYAMTDRSLRKLNRRELLELLIALKEENNQLKERLQQQSAQLHSREIQIQNAGSMAEAALALNDVFESVDKAAAQYLENIKRCSEQQNSVYDRIVSEAEQKAKAILEDAENERQQKLKTAEKYLNKVKASVEESKNAPDLQELISYQPRRRMSEIR